MSLKLGDSVILNLLGEYGSSTCRQYDGIIGKIVGITGNIEVIVTYVPYPNMTYTVGQKCSLPEKYWSLNSVLDKFQLTKESKL